MNGLRRSAATAAMLLSITIGAATADELVKQPKEMLTGQYTCLTFPTSGPQTHGSLSLTGTSGLFASGAGEGPQIIYADFEAGGLPVCEAFARDARAKLEAVGCMASRVKTVDPSQNDNSARRSVQFVCTGPRDKMVDTLARIVELVVMNGR